MRADGKCYMTASDFIAKGAPPDEAARLEKDNANAETACTSASQNPPATIAWTSRPIQSQNPAGKLPGAGGMTVANLTQGKLDDQKKMFLMIGAGSLVAVILLAVILR